MHAKRASSVSRPYTFRAGLRHRVGCDPVLGGRQCGRKAASSVSWPYISHERSSAIVLDVITYGAAFSAREKGQQRQQALHLLRAMQRHRAR